MNHISIVLPIYNEAQGIPELISETQNAMAGFSYEIIAVNDGSKDNSFEVLKSIAEKDKSVKVINLKRNYG